MSGAVDVLERIVPHLPESVNRVERRLRVASQRVPRVYVPALLVQIIRANAVVGRDVDLRELPSKLVVWYSKPTRAASQPPRLAVAANSRCRYRLRTGRYSR